MTWAGVRLDGTPSIAWDRAKLRSFKRMHARAKTLPGVESFVWEGHQFLVSYAGYLIQYLEGRGL